MFNAWNARPSTVSPISIITQTPLTYPNGMAASTMAANPVPQPMFGPFNPTPPISLPFVQSSSLCSDAEVVRAITKFHQSVLLPGASPSPVFSDMRSERLKDMARRLNKMGYAAYWIGTYVYIDPKGDIVMD